jgi:hypothetical protein
MPFCPETGIPYGKSPFAFSGGTGKARFCSFASTVGCSIGVGDASAASEGSEVDRRDGCFVVVFLGWLGWKAFEIDLPTLLKKSPTGSAATHCPAKNNSAVTGMQIQRVRRRRVFNLQMFKVKLRFSVKIETKEKKKSFRANGL